MAETNGVSASPAAETMSKAADTTNSNAPVQTNGVKDESTSEALPDGVNINNTSRRPRDARTIHLMLASLGVTSYQERVPLALMDMAYRYTTSILQDALLYNDITSNNTSASANPNITLSDLRMAIASRVNHQFVTAPPKEFMLDIAQERNKIALPVVKRDWGVRLPPEQYCLTGVNWELLAEDEVEDDEEEDEDGDDVFDDEDVEGDEKMETDEAKGEEGREEEMGDVVADLFGGGDDGDENREDGGGDDAEGDKDMGGI